MLSFEKKNMEGLKNLINMIVGLFKFLIWTILILYSFMGIWKLINGNPKMTYENEYKAIDFAATCLFLTVILIPSIYLGYYLFTEEPYMIPIETSADYVVMYVVLLFIVCAIGFINNLASED